MSEAELYSALETAVANAYTLSDSAIAVLTGYLLIAFFLGDKLSRFQVFFATLLFTLMYTSYQVSIWGQLSRMAHFNEELELIGSEIPTDDIYWHFSPVISAGLAIGALFFMWSVRHSKKK